MLLTTIVISPAFASSLSYIIQPVPGFPIDPQVGTKHMIALKNRIPDLLPAMFFSTNCFKKESDSELIIFGREIQLHFNPNNEASELTYNQVNLAVFTVGLYYFTQLDFDKIVLYTKLCEELVAAYELDVNQIRSKL